MSGWDYVSAGGCRRCDALEGYHEQEPTRPHEFCQCTITPVETTNTASYRLSLEVVEDGAEYKAFPPDSGEQDYDYDLLIGVEWEVVVRCRDGTEYSEGYTESFETTVTTRVAAGDDVDAIADQLIEEYGRSVTGQIQVEAMAVAQRLHEDNCAEVYS